MADLRCPDCGAEITAILVYTGGGYMGEHRDVGGYECDDYSCGAEWDHRGKQTATSRKETLT